MKVRTRFAPSPTGFLHVGGLRTALYNYLFAKKNNGEFILRIEDTDQNRITKSATENLITILSDFQLNYDFGPNILDQYGPYIQSKRLTIYEKYYLKLIKNKKAYVCFVDKKNTNLLIPEYDVNQALSRITKESFLIKLKVNQKKTITVCDEIRGKITFDLNLIEDPIIIKSDGFPTYHFANVVDDHLMKITHVIRGEEWISSLPKHAILYEAFGWSSPKFIHLPLLLNPDKSKLSKRQGDVAVDEFIKQGYLKNALINFVALLGWHPDNDDEIISLNQLIKLFSLNRINKSGAVFDKEKLNWMNREYIKKISSQDFKAILKKTLSKNQHDIDELNIIKIAKYCKNRITRLDQIWDEIAFFYEYPKIQKDLLLTFEYKDLFSLWIKELGKLSSLNKKNIDFIIIKSEITLHIIGKNLFFPLRLALTGKTHGPNLFSLINILGIQNTITRLKQASNEL